MPVTECRRNELIEEVNSIRQAGEDPANMARTRLIEIADELLGIDHVAPETHAEWKARTMRDSAFINQRRVRRA